VDSALCDRAVSHDLPSRSRHASSVDVGADARTRVALKAARVPRMTIV
jgi:hypothetical protein